MTKLAAAGLGLLLLLVVVVSGAAGGILGATTTAYACMPATPNAPPAASGGLGLDAEQLLNASIIIGIGQRVALPPRAAVIAIATALQESSLRNLPGGDRDSIGLFQQRPSQGWGAPAQLHDPTYAATAFYTHLVQIPGWQTLPLTHAAQAVQHSATPNAYAQWEPLATRVVAGSLAVACQQATAPNDAARTAIAYAHAQLGLPYEWGAERPGEAFDCSGLTQAAYAAAGITLPRVAQDQYNHGPHVPAGAPLLPGDLVFYGTPHNIHHVGLYTGNGQMIDAPHTGATIRQEPYHWPRDDYLGATRPSVIQGAEVPRSFRTADLIESASGMEECQFLSVVEDSRRSSVRKRSGW